MVDSVIDKPKLFSQVRFSAVFLSVQQSDHGGG